MYTLKLWWSFWKEKFRWTALCQKIMLNVEECKDILIGWKVMEQDSQRLRWEYAIKMELIGRLLTQKILQLAKKFSLFQINWLLLKKKSWMFLVWAGWIGTLQSKHAWIGKKKTISASGLSTSAQRRSQSIQSILINSQKTPQCMLVPTQKMH